ncbi:hypothetical protein [Alkalicoccus chagannorensis]|uniref:hypothetical protein n=1 Tax=Alkalicoccus chagannorensis TaxID=427072 RepID=UPI0012EC73F9|nr:hypothetical protein [Alkalicoccus chagannorensis]
MMKYLIVGILLLLGGCAASEASFAEADRATPFRVIAPEELPGEWKLNEFIEEESLVIAEFSLESRGHLELIQDPYIQGLDDDLLRRYLTGAEQLYPSALPENEDIMRIDDFVGVWSMLDTETTQFTFVRLNDLYEYTPKQMPRYQIIGSDIEEEEIKHFIKQLGTISS